ncbi:DUF4041 domain-containing protein [Curtobacterium sp. MCBA15_009]|uniref:DUF4041 domain-containing protein n=1 Tax=Curtobacterium sp. MCBA15_009 TaxID=1898737 RepID=UPI0020C88BCD|nr:DUF4041 domain-containing protein [Curtobacterium sp. MCBA15_009]
MEEIDRGGELFVVLPVGRGIDAPCITIPKAMWTGAAAEPRAAAQENRGTDSGSSPQDLSTVLAFADPRDRRIAELEAEVARIRNASSVGADVPLDDQQVLQSVGIYRYHHPLENAAAYKERLTVIEAAVAALVREGRAIERSNMFTFDNSLAKGRKMSDDLSKLMLRAYNAEADSAVRSLRAGNVETAKRRLEKSREAIARLGAMMEMRIALDYHDLRVEEVELTSDWLMRKQEEREFERDERARLREEKRVQQELDAERERLDKERALIEQTIERLRSNGEVDADLEARLSQIDAAIEQNDFRAANIRAGYVYVISNRGAFGPDVVKIGLTRRLEPSDRVNELGGASVPFRFDVHTIYFSEDAVTLETELHRHFATRALNQANPRKEFFFATPAEVREVLMQKVGALLEFREEAEATEYLQSVGAWPTRVVPMS